MKVEKKKIMLQIIVMIILLILVIGITYTCFKSKRKEINIQSISNGALSMMLQNEDGEYEKANRTTWPTSEEGYVFNSKLSRCENGSELIWKNNKITIKTSSSDKCYIYFDKKKEVMAIINTGDEEEVLYEGGWTNKEIKFVITYPAEEGKTYQYSTDKSSWKNFTDNLTISTDQQATYYFRTTKNGEIKEIGSYGVKIDRTPPTINPTIGTQLSSSYEVTITDIGITDTGGSGWTGEYTIEYKKQSEGDDQYKPIEVINSNTLKFPENGAYIIRITARDNAGNMNSITKNITSSCFVAGTKVLTKFGPKNIEDIKVGELVWSVSETSGQKELKRVLQTIISWSDELYELKVGDEIIKATPRHRFYVIDKGWVRAYNLEEGDYLVNETNTSKQKIEEIRYTKFDKAIPVYNLVIEDNHNYLVSGYGLLVHNVNSPSIDPGGNTNPGGNTTVGKDNVTLLGAVNAYGETIEIEITDPEIAAGETVDSVAQDAIKAAEEVGIDLRGANASYVFGLGINDELYSTMVILADTIDTGEIVTVLYQSEDGSWDSASFYINDDDTITIVIFDYHITISFDC